MKFFFWVFLEGGGHTGYFVDKNKNSRKDLKHIHIGSVFNADSKYDVGFNSIRSFFFNDQNHQVLAKKTHNPTLRTVCLWFLR
jgi:hypothetical protein